MFQQNHTTKDNKTIVKEDEIIQFLQLLYEKKNMLNFVKLFNDIVFYNHNEFHGTTENTKFSTKINTDTDNDIVFSYTQSSLSKITSDNNTSFDYEIYKLYLYQSTIYIKLYSHGSLLINDKIVFKFKYTNLENFYKCKNIFIEILKLYDHLYSDNSITKENPIIIEDKLNRGDITHSIKSIDYFLNSLEEILKYYKDTNFNVCDNDMSDNNTIMDINIFIATKEISNVLNKTTNLSSALKNLSLDDIKDTIRLNYSFQLCCEFLQFGSLHTSREFLHSSDLFHKKYLSIPINDYRNMCETLRKYNTYQRYTNDYANDKIFPCEDNNDYNSDEDLHNINDDDNNDRCYKQYFQFTKGFESIICEDESVNKFKVVKPIQ